MLLISLLLFRFIYIDLIFVTEAITISWRVQPCDICGGNSLLTIFRLVKDQPSDWTLSFSPINTR